MPTATDTPLAAPLTLPSGQILQNRMMKAALSEGLADESGAPGARLRQLYSRWARGRYGLVVTGNVMVDGRHLGEPGNVVVADDRHLPELTRWAQTTQDGGARIWMQLNHPGRQANPLAGSARPVAPSPVAMAIPGVPAPRELTGEEILEIVARFAAAAAVAESAGFDGVQIHGAHGYLVSQFLSPLSNRRTDEWGGAVEDRARFLLDTVRAVRAAVRPGFGVGVKLNSADFQRGGFTEADSRAVVAMVAAEQVDLIEISGGSYESPAMMGRPSVSAGTRAREAYFLEYAETVREATAGIPLAVTGGFRTRAGMADAVAGGACDVVGLGRPSALAPDAAGDIAANRAAGLPTHTVALPAPARLRGAVPQLKSLEGALDLQWHTDQLHRMAGGADPDPSRPVWRTAVTAVRRNGVDALRSRRGSERAAAERARRKFRVERFVGRRIANPIVEGLSKLGVSSTVVSRIETTGRTSGRPRTVPVSATFDAEGAWLISQHGMRAGWTRNIAHDPAVRIWTAAGWRDGTAQIMPDDDVDARARTFSPHPALAGITASAFRSLQSDPVSVRVTFTD